MQNYHWLSYICPNMQRYDITFVMKQYKRHSKNIKNYATFYAQILADLVTSTKTGTKY